MNCRHHMQRTERQPLASSLGVGDHCAALIRVVKMNGGIEVVLPELVVTGH